MKKIDLVISFILLLICLIMPLKGFAGEESDMNLVTVLGVGSGQTPAFDGFNPLLSTTEASEQLESLYNYPLLYIGKKMNIKFQKSIAKSIEISNNEKKYNIKIHKGIYWSNGEPVTAKNILYCYDEIKELGPLFPNQGLAGIPNNIANIVLKNKYEITINLKKRINPTYFELDGLTMLNPIYKSPVDVDKLEKESFEINDFRESDGPYRLTAYKRGDYIDLVSNSRYKFGQSEHYYNGLTFKLSNNQLTEVLGILSGHSQIVDVPALYDGLFNKSKRKSLYISKNGFIGFNFIAINYKNQKMAKFKSWNLRSKISHMINQEAIIKSVYNGYAYKMHGVISKIQKQEIVKSGSNRSIALVRKNKIPKEDLIDINSQKITLICSNNITDKSIAEIVKYDLRKNGINIKIKILQPNLLISKLRSKNWDMALVSFSTNYIPTVSMLLGNGGRFNFSGYSNMQLQKIFKRISESKDNKALKEELTKMNNFIKKRQPFIVLPHPETLLAHQEGLHGMGKSFPNQGGFWPQYLYANLSKASHN